MTNVDLPVLPDSHWRKALAMGGHKGTGTGSYQAPGGTAIFFVVENTELSGGTSVDTTELPFWGRWSSRGLNEKPQEIKLEVSMDGSSVLIRRNALVEALRTPTSDSDYGFLDLALWGRFPVIVSGWSVKEEYSKQGGVKFHLQFLRVPLESKGASFVPLSVESAADKLKDTAVLRFENSLTSSALSVQSLRKAFGNISKNLLSVIGRVQATQSTLNALTSEVTKLLGIINQGVLSPRKLAMTLFGCMASIASSLIGVEQSLMGYFKSPHDRSFRNHFFSILLLLSSHRDKIYTPGSISENKSNQASQELYGAVLFYGMGLILSNIQDSRFVNIKILFDLFRQLEISLASEDPFVFSSCLDLRISVDHQIKSRRLRYELVQEVERPANALFLSNMLASDYDEFLSMNIVRDQHYILGNVTY